jgi:O-acetyl-ADP-ribose deacetylase (regulator of RNase III)
VRKTATDNFGSDSDVAARLTEFCRALKRLRDEAGGPSVADLGHDAGVPLKRAQIHEVLAGRITRPPSWDFVREFVLRCRSYGVHGGRRPSVSTDLEWWRREHGFLTEVADRAYQRGSMQIAGPAWTREHREVSAQELLLFRLGATPDGGRRQIGVITGDIRQVRCADIWVNSENTDMIMARIQESSISAIIRYEGSVRDLAGRVVVDVIADELEAKVREQRPLTPAATVVTGAGELERRNGVRYVIHIAAVHGEPGSGFHPVKAVDRCVENALAEAERLDAGRTILFPLLGTGVAGGPVDRTALTLITTAVNYLSSVRVTRLSTILFLAYTRAQLRACRRALEASGLKQIRSDAAWREM